MLPVKKYSLLTFLLGALLLGACCRGESEDIAALPLSEDVQQLCPYELGQRIPFVHSGGYAFEMLVVDASFSWQKEYNFCEWHCCDNDYYSYQNKTAVLQSETPALTLSLELEPEFYDSSLFGFSIRLNRFSHYLYCDSMATFLPDQSVSILDSITLLGHLYYDVLEIPLHSFFNDEDSALHFSSVLFNDYGLLQIKMSNGETYTAHY